MRHRIGDDRDIHNTIEARRHAQVQSRTLERWGGGATSDHFGPLVFGAVILAAPYPRCFWPPMHISKYNGKTNPDHWLED